MGRDIRAGIEGAPVLFIGGYSSALSVTWIRRGRQVALPRFAVEALRGHKVRQAEQRLALGPSYTDQGVVFAMPDGAFLKPDSFTSAFAAAGRKMGLSRLNFHALRHSHATILLKQGINPKVVSERLGHAKVSTTLDVYSHVHILPGMQVEAALRIDSTFRFAINREK